MAESDIDSRAAARIAARLLLVSLAIGAAAGAATFLFVFVDHYGVEWLWHKLPSMVPSIPPVVVSVGVVAAMTAVAALVVTLYGTRPYDSGKAEEEFDHEGRMEYHNLPAGVVFSLASLFSGAVIGPEAPLTDLSGGIGTWVADRLHLEPKHVRLMAYAGVAGAFGAFFGAAPVGAILAAELISPKEMHVSRLDLAIGLASGASGYVLYDMLGGHSISAMLLFPQFEATDLRGLAVAVLVGAIGALFGLLYGRLFVTLRVRLQNLRTRPWLAALAGGLPVAIAAVISPYLLFSGQSETPTVIAEAASLGILVLLGLGLAKLFLSVWSLSTAYFGGPVFPLIFAGTCFGLALSLALPFIPQGVAVMALVTGMVVAATAAPFSVTIFLALIAEPALAPAIAVAAVAAFIIRQAVAPTLPGVYRATRKREAETAAAAG